MSAYGELPVSVLTQRIEDVPRSHRQEPPRPMLRQPLDSKIRQVSCGCTRIYVYSTIRLLLER